mmetsp:Transcript_9722/g.24051  ORF Transcript_9722/g.24051 Transcript_9722/m.24051 type:complete len:339 (+) Transcript_9722:575-1591(+)
MEPWYEGFCHSPSVLVPISFSNPFITELNRTTKSCESICLPQFFFSMLSADPIRAHVPSSPRPNSGMLSQISSSVWSLDMNLFTQRRPLPSSKCGRVSLAHFLSTNQHSRSLAMISAIFMAALAAGNPFAILPIVGSALSPLTALWQYMGGVRAWESVANSSVMRKAAFWSAVIFTTLSPAVSSTGASESRASLLPPLPPLLLPLSPAPLALALSLPLLTLPAPYLFSPLPSTPSSPNNFVLIAFQSTSSSFSTIVAAAAGDTGFLLLPEKPVGHEKKKEEGLEGGFVSASTSAAAAASPSSSSFAASGAVVSASASASAASFVSAAAAAAASLSASS